MIIKLQEFARMPKEARIKLVKEYPVKAVREKNYNIEIIVKGRNGQVWCPIDYCIAEVITFPEIERLVDELRTKNA